MMDMVCSEDGEGWGYENQNMVGRGRERKASGSARASDIARVEPRERKWTLSLYATVKWDLVSCSYCCEDADSYTSCKLSQRTDSSHSSDRPCLYSTRPKPCSINSAIASDECRHCST